MKRPFGIDLGTTYSTIALYNPRGGPQVIRDNSGNSAIPSMVSYFTDQIYCGNDAAVRQRENSASTIYDSKRMLGQGFNCPRINFLKKDWQFKIEENKEDGGILIDIPSQHKKIQPVDASAEILKHLVNDVGNKRLPRNLKNQACVITVPANFTAYQREATKLAAKKAGLTCIRLLNEPTAAGIACAHVYDYFSESKSSQVLIYDFGGGTLDVSLLKVEPNNRKTALIFTVKAIDGDNNLGGRDFDELILKYVVETLHLDVTNQRLLTCARDAVIEAKILLSSQDSADVLIYYGDKQYKTNLTRAKFEEISSSLIQRCITPVKRLLAKHRIPPNEIDDIILTGGSSHIPCVKNILTEFFEKEPFAGIDPRDAVAQGAAIVAYQIMNDKETDVDRGLSDNENDKLIECASRSLGIETRGGIMSFHITRDQVIPLKESRIYNNYANNPNLAINIFEGENIKIEDNDFLGCFVINNIPKCGFGEAPVEVVFEMSEDGIFTVKAYLVKNGEKTNEVPVSRHPGYYTLEQARKRNLIIGSAIEIRKENAEPLRRFYQSVKDYFSSSNCREKIFIGQGMINNIIQECDKGIKDPLFSSPNVSSAKDKFKAMLDLYIRQHKTIPDCLK